MTLLYDATTISTRIIYRFRGYEVQIFIIWDLIQPVTQRRRVSISKLASKMWNSTWNRLLVTADYTVLLAVEQEKDSTINIYEYQVKDNIYCLCKFASLFLCSFISIDSEQHSSLFIR